MEQVKLTKIKITKLRKNIDKVDEQIIKSLTKRQKIAKEIGLCKKKIKQDIFDKQRENEVINSRQKLGKKQGLNEKYVEALFKVIMKESKKNQASRRKIKGE